MAIRRMSIRRMSIRRFCDEFRVFSVYLFSI